MQQAAFPGSFCTASRFTRLMAFPSLTSGRLWACGIASLAALATLSYRNTPIHADSKVEAARKPAWDYRAAAQYLDGREVWWQAWDHARRDHDTRCVSCHTQASYALARPQLRTALGESAPSLSEKAMLADIEKRVRNWDQMLPFYSDAKFGAGKEIESRNAESVLNAVILSSYDAQQKHQSELTRLAFDHAWELQSHTGPESGAWVWQDFGYTPWESKESQFHWAALMTVAVAREPAAVFKQPSVPSSGQGPASYASDPRVAPHLEALLGYLRNHYEEQPLLNKLVALWAAAYFPGTVSPRQEQKLIADLDRLQHDDGGWSASDLGAWQRRDGTPLDKRSDGYATGLIVCVREEGAAKAYKIPQVARGLAWLIANQDRATGSWPAWSLNKNRDPNSDAGLFMTDAATSYAVLALEKSPESIH